MATDAKTGQPIFHGSTRAGLRNVGSYQVSGMPYITGSSLVSGQEVQISFPYVTKEITVIASGSSIGPLRVHFNSISASYNVTGSGGNHFISLDSHEDAVTFNVKCKEIWLSTPQGDASGFRLYASLTNIPTSSMFALTGSGLTDGSDTV